MKAIFDPLVLKNVMLATPAEIVANGQTLDEFKKRSAPVNAAVEALTGSYQTRLYNERGALLTPEVQATIRKNERDRTPEEQKIFDDYYPVLRIDADKIKQVMSKEEIAKYNALLKQQQSIARPFAGLLRDHSTLVVFTSEFGRTPWSQNTTGRDHNTTGFTSLLAAGGVKGGVVEGATDEVGYRAVEKPHYISDLQSTILQQKGLNYKKMDFVLNGRPFHLVEEGLGPIEAILQ